MLRQHSPSTVVCLGIMCVVFGASSFDLFTVKAYVPATNFHSPPLRFPASVITPRKNHGMCRRVVSRSTSSSITEASALEDQDKGNIEDDQDISFLFEENQTPPVVQDETLDNLDPTERVWRYANKPLLRIGSKGATHSHGNSLRQLLDDHTVVKVKVNTKKFQNSVQQAYQVLNALAIENGAPADIELIQLREGTNEILFGMPGTLEKMQQGTFPPLPPAVVASVDEDNDEEDEDGVRGYQGSAGQKTA